MSTMEEETATTEDESTDSTHVITAARTKTKYGLCFLGKSPGKMLAPIARSFHIKNRKWPKTSYPKLHIAKLTKLD